MQILVQSKARSRLGVEVSRFDSRDVEAIERGAAA
jgi:hypothetical protein